MAKFEMGILILAKTRNWHFELLRIFAMLLILTTHYFAADNWSVQTDPRRASSWMAALHNSLQMSGQIGVTLFVLISAYFLSTSSSNPVKRIIRLWIQVFTYSAGCFLTYIIIASIFHTHPAFLTFRNILASIFPITMGTYWFMSAFFVMLALSPFMNKLAGSLSYRNFSIFIAIMIWVTFIWRILNPLTIQYFTDVGYLCSIYLIGAFTRRYGNNLPKVSFWTAAIICLVCFSICVFGTHQIAVSGTSNTEFGYPMNLLTAGPGAAPILSVVSGSALFLWVSSLSKPRTNSLSARLILAFAPATLGVYLIHENFIVKSYLWSFVFRNQEPSSIMAKVITATTSVVALYLVFLLISLLIYRIILKPILKLVDRQISKIDMSLA